MSITTVGSHLIHYEVLGRGQPLIFLHGWLGSWRYWWPSMQAMAAQHRAFAFDLWGFGDSSKAPDKYTISAYMEMIDQFINQLGVAKPVILIGHSLGAAVALRYTVAHPENVSKLATVAMPVTGAYLNDRLATSDPDNIINRVVGKSNSFSEVDTEIRKIDQAAFNQLAQELANNNLVPDMANFPRPLLLVYGGQDSVVQPPDGEYSYLQQSANDRFFVTLDQCGHFPMLQDKARFNRLLLDFILASDELTELTPKEYWQRRTR